MKHILLTILFLLTLITSAQTTIGKVSSYDPQFSKIISTDAKIELLATGLIWAEGPVWVKEGNYLLFSDAPQNTIFRWDQKNGLQPFLKPAGYTGLGKYSDEPGSNGLLINLKGELVACEHGDRRISAMSLTSGGKQTIADGWKRRRFNSPNDICQHSDGTYYFTDPVYGLPLREKDTLTRELDIEGVYAADDSGNVHCIIKGLVRPNGIALTTDEKTLYVSQSNGGTPFIMAYKIKPGDPFMVDKGTVFFDFSKHPEVSKAAADGIKIDSDGNMYAAAANGIVVISPQGKLLGKIETGVPTSNCNFGTDGYLYITAQHNLCRIKLK